MTDDLTIALSSERVWLVRLCSHLTTSRDAAEDLAQETLLEAWRAREKLRDLEGIRPWLAAIARNVCLRYRRQLGRDHGRLLTYDTSTLDVADEPADETAFTLAKDDSDVATVLSRALATLPVSTRRTVEAAYIQEQPRDEMAQALQISEAALRVRLHRGLGALRQELMGALRGDAIAAGLVLPEATGWTTTRIWCPWCGQHYLELKLERTSRRFSFRCRGPCAPQLAQIGSGILPQDLTSPKPILTRLCVTLGNDYRRALATGSEVCPRCGGAVRIQRWPTGDEQMQQRMPYGVLLRCDKCSIFDTASPLHLALDTPETQSFWRRHRRMRALPIQEIEVEGRPALLTGFESAVGSERLLIISALDTYELLHVAGNEAG
jgi:RNA polymerase sigma factor (sigma-70 family)